jgi:hypothetical protein
MEQFRQTCRALFLHADTDGSGALDSDEVVLLLQSKNLGLNLSQQQLDNVLVDGDMDGDGLITLEEFVPLVERLFCSLALGVSKSPAPAKQQSSPYARRLWQVEFFVLLFYDTCLR